MQRYYSMASSRMKIRTIEDYIIKTYASTRHILCPMFKSYFVKDKAALLRGEWEYRSKFASKTCTKLEGLEECINRGRPHR